MKRKQVEKCPVCDRKFDKGNYKTRHHIFPKYWYESNVVVEVCHTCHQVEFNNMFPIGHRVWSLEQCINNWVKFCKLHKKDALKIYPSIENTLITLDITASKSDKALIIGKGSKMIQSIRSILLVSAVRDKVGINLKIID